MKIIFLDFDGVIRMPVFGGPRIEAEFCRERMLRVAELATSHDARIVISSDWRQRYGYAEIMELLEPSIPRTLVHRDWATPILTASPENEEVIVPRGAEIIAWLSRNPETKAFVILDDLGASHFPTMRPKLVQCHLEDGFTEERFEEAGRLLAGSAVTAG